MQWNKVPLCYAPSNWETSYIEEFKIYLDKTNSRRKECCHVHLTEVELKQVWGGHAVAQRKLNNLTVKNQNQTSFSLVRLFN